MGDDRSKSSDKKDDKADTGSFVGDQSLPIPDKVRPSDYCNFRRVLALSQLMGRNPYRIPRPDTHTCWINQLIQT